MKIFIKPAIIIFAASCCLAACKGGVSGEKEDSTMVNKQVMDSTASQNKKAGTMAADSGAGPKADTSKMNK